MEQNFVVNGKHGGWKNCQFSFRNKSNDLKLVYISSYELEDLSYMFVWVITIIGFQILFNAKFSASTLYALEINPFECISRLMEFIQNIFLFTLFLVDGFTQLNRHVSVFNIGIERRWRDKKPRTSLKFSPNIEKLTVFKLFCTTLESWKKLIILFVQKYTTKNAHYIFSADAPIHRVCEIFPFHFM